MILDLILAGLIIFAIAQGFNRGLLPTLFALIGYLGGGVIGLFAAKELSGDWSGVVSIVGLYLVAIFAGAQLGSWLMAKVGARFRKRILPKSVKVIDGVLGGLLSAMSVLILAWTAIVFLSFLPNSELQSELRKSLISNKLKQYGPSTILNLGERLG